MPEGTQNAFIDLDLNRIQWEDAWADTETTADVTPPAETVDTSTQPWEDTITPPVEEPATVAEESIDDVVDVPEETPDVEETDPEKILERALALGDDAEEVIDSLPDSQEKDDLQKIIDEQQATIESLTKDRNDFMFEKETASTKIKDMERLYGKLDDQPTLKQLILYSQKSKSDESYKDKKIEVLKELLKQEGVDIADLEKKAIEQEKTALGWVDSTKMTVGYKWGESDWGFIPLWQ